MKKITTFESSLIKNNYAYSMYLNKLIELSLGLFEWHNLPSSIDSLYLERILFSNGSILFFKDEVLGYLALPYLGDNNVNVYNQPITRTISMPNGYYNTLTKDNSVIIYNNMLYSSGWPICQYYAMQLWNLDQIININASAQKTPLLLIAPENQRLTVLNLYKEYDGNAPVIFGDKELDISSLKVLKTDAPFIVDKLYNYKIQLWSEALSQIGVENLPFEKKERMITTEIETTQGSTINTLQGKLKTRSEAAKKINERFNLNISVTTSSSYNIDEIKGETNNNE